VIKKPLRDWVCLVGEGLSCSWGTVFDSSKTSINVSESYSHATLVGVDDILECGLRATRQ
jgi:hypothetical protein